MLYQGEGKVRSIRLLVTTVFVSIVAFSGTYWAFRGDHNPQTAELDRNSTKLLEEPIDRFSEMPSAFGEWQRQIRTPIDLTRPEYPANYLIQEFDKRLKTSASLRVEAETFTERGPGNIGGRTRALIVLQTDSTRKTWLAGAASGGIWKTTDGGFSWTEKSTSLPNLAISSLANSDANPNIIYAGTGEPFCGFPSVDGYGVFKSSDAGESWSLVLDPADFPDLKNISRVVVDPSDENHVLVSGENSFYGDGLSSTICRTTDGGATWVRTYSTNSNRIQQLTFEPGNFGTMYAALNGNGVIKSLDSGRTWTNTSSGLNIAGRIEIGVSPVNTNRIWASTEGSQSGTGSDLYVSDDAGSNWRLVVSTDEDNPDFLEGQGCYDNTVLAHPSNADIVYVGGVDLWKFTLQAGDGPEIQLVEVNEDGTGSFMDFVNFGATYYDGKIETGSVESLINVELRFGEGTQKAHRFIVNNQGSGVPDDQYEYVDYTDVPFQAWDTESNRQLMISFRDQSEDGRWNLIAQNTNGDPSTHSREYVYIHSTTYSDSASTELAVNGGHVVNQLYNMWPVLAAEEFNAGSLPISKVSITATLIPSRIRSTFQISDSRNITTNSINVSRQTPAREDDGIHPDHHILKVFGDTSTTDFQILNGNDGGVYLSNLSNDPATVDSAFEFRSFGYNTSQFYAADKAPGENRYVGGMQDNGTQISPLGENASDSTNYAFANSGDGFEAIWNKRNGNMIITTSQNNGFRRTLDGGTTWSGSEFSDTGPFYTKLSNSNSKPDKLYALGAQGVWISRDFGGSWELSPIESSQWNLNNFSPYVEVSNADNDIVWAGSGLTDANRLFVSDDGGLTFDPVEVYTGETLGSISGLTLDPKDAETAYALFSFATRPKILKTTNLGQTWNDISGFEGNTVSDRGFPDVAIFSLLVFNYNTDRLWAGTEIGIYESTDGGASWAPLESNLPPVSVFDFKIVDDQVVLATYGRGIWSVTIPEVEEEIVFSPFLGNVFIGPMGTTSFEVEFSSVFDSTVITVNGDEVISLTNNNLGSQIQEIQNLGIDGLAAVQISSFSDGNTYKSDPLERVFFEPKAVADGYKTSFNDNPTADFASSGFSISTGSFSSGALQTEHDYAQATELISVLKTPIQVSSTNPIMTYRDVAIIETGEDGSEFGDIDFYDYVVVEGSTDGKNWKPLADGYDASFNEVWLDAYNSGSAGTEDMFVEHNIDLTETFEVGDVILIRFRLFSDPFTVGWGWLVDDIHIQEQILSTAVELLTDLKIYPNPVSESSSIEYSTRNSGQLSLIGLDGKIIWMKKLNKGSGIIPLSNSNLNPGVYLLKLEVNDSKVIRKVIINR